MATKILPVLLSDGPRSFHIQPKPVGAQCNLDCKYCYYLSKENLLHQPKIPRMSDEILEEYVRQYLINHTGDEVIFTWHGGEPTLAGIDYFRRAIAFQKTYARADQVILNDLQTNGTLLDDEWFSFLKEENFLVGISFDGPESIHNSTRKTKGGTGTYEAVVSAIKKLQINEIPFMVMCCVSSVSEGRAIEIYRFLVNEIGADRISFIPVVEPKLFRQQAPWKWDWLSAPVQNDGRVSPAHERSVVESWSISPVGWGNFLREIFEEWKVNGLGRVYVNWFESMVSWRIGQGSLNCTTSEICGKNLAVEHTGELFACDHFVYPEYRRGSITEDRLDQIVFSPEQIGFGYSKRERLPNQCRTCPVLNDCWGGCPKDRFLKTTDGENGLHYLCQGFKNFFTEASPYFDELSKGILKQ